MSTLSTAYTPPSTVSKCSASAPIHTHLELSQREPTPEADSRSIDKRQQVPVPLELLCLFRHTILCQPALGVELPCIRPPDFRPGVHEVDRNRDNITLCDRDAIDDGTCGCLQGSREWNNGIFSCLVAVGTVRLVQHMSDTRVRTMRVVSPRGGCSRSVSCTTASRYGNPFVSWSQVGSPLEICESSLRNFAWISGFLHSSTRHH